MKTLLLPILALCSTLLPLSAVDFGGFQPGTTFVFKVTEKSSIKSSGLTVTNPAPVARGIPNYSVGQTVTFKIGRRGELTGPGFKVPLLKTGIGFDVNAYATKPGLKTIIGHLFGKTGNVSTSCDLNFFYSSVRGRTVTTNAVVYFFEKP